MGKNKWRYRSHYQNDDSIQQDAQPANSHHNQSRHNGRSPSDAPQLGSYTVTSRNQPDSNFSSQNPFQRNNPPQGPRNATLDFNSNTAFQRNPSQGPRNATSNFSSENPFQRNNRSQRPPNALTTSYNISHIPRGFDENAFMLKSMHLKQHLIQSMNQNLQQIQQWYPDEEENLSNDEMDWQPENEILILPPICEIRYVCDPEPAELGLRRACGIGLDKTDVYQEPPMLGTVMSKGASEAGLCTEKRIGCTIKLDRVLEVPRKGLIYVP